MSTTWNEIKWDFVSLDLLVLIPLNANFRILKQMYGWRRKSTACASWVTVQSQQPLCLPSETTLKQRVGRMSQMNGKAKTKWRIAEVMACRIKDEGVKIGWERKDVWKSRNPKGWAAESRGERGGKMVTGLQEHELNWMQVGRSYCDAGLH